MGKDEKIIIVPMMYLGERVVGGGRIHQLFRDKDGNEGWWAGVKGVYFGRVYETKKSGSGDTEKHQITRNPNRVEDETLIWKPTEKDENEYEAQKIVVAAARRERQHAMEIKKPHKDILKAIELLTPFFRSLDGYDQNRFMGWVRSRCVKGIYVRPKKRRR